MVDSLITYVNYIKQCTGFICGFAPGLSWLSCSKIYLPDLLFYFLSLVGLKFALQLSCSIAHIDYTMSNPNLEPEQRKSQYPHHLQFY